MTMCLDSLVMSLPLILYNAIADMDDARYIAHMVTLIAPQPFREH
jgi:hypothetical protein